MESVEVLAFIYYMVTAARYLRKSTDSQSVLKDPYTMAMILLLCELSVFRIVASLPFGTYYLICKIPTEDRNVPYYLQPDFSQSTFRYMYEFLDYSAIRIAILVNLTRWVLVYISLSKTDLSDKLRRSRSAQYALCILIFLELLISGLEHAFKTDGLFLLMMEIWTKYIIVVIPLVGYIVLYYKIKEIYV
jgi:hypothetical protein